MVGSTVVEVSSHMGVAQVRRARAQCMHKCTRACITQATSVDALLSCRTPPRRSRVCGIARCLAAAGSEAICNVNSVVSTAWHQTERSDLMIKLKNTGASCCAESGRAADGGGGEPWPEARGAATRTRASTTSTWIMQALVCGEWWADQQNLRTKCSTKQAGLERASARQAPRYGASRQCAKHQVRVGFKDRPPQRLAAR